MLADKGSSRDLWPPPESIDGDECWLVEGEADALTLAELGLPGVAIPGIEFAKRVKEWAPRFARFSRVNVMFDCDEADPPKRPMGGREARQLAVEELAKHVGDVRALDLDSSRTDGYDVTEAHLEAIAASNGEGRAEVRRMLEVTAGAAEPFTPPPSDNRATVQHPPTEEMSEAEGDEDEGAEEVIDPHAEWEKCAGIATEPRILDYFVADVNMRGLVGEDDAARLLYLVTTSRLLDKPVSVAVKGPSSGGKSFTVSVVLEFFPSTAVHGRSSMSERALVYGEASLKHKILLVYEAAGLGGEDRLSTALLRSLLSEGRLDYETVDSTPKGLKARVITREGPTGLIITTTATRLDSELETRLVSLHIKDTKEQTKAVIEAMAEAEDEDVELPDVRHWLALQRWLEAGERKVRIPYAKPLGRLIKPMGVRLRRDVPTLFGLIKAHAVLHRASRQVDAKGRVLAELQDYAVVRELVAALISQGVGATVSPEVRATVEAVASLSDRHPDGVPQRALVSTLDVDKGVVSRRVRAALDNAYLRNLEQSRGKPHRLVVGEPLPDTVEILPTVHALEDELHRCTVAGEGGGRDAGRPNLALVSEEVP